MKINILSLFPEMFAPLQQSLIGKARENGLLKVDIVNFRDYTTNKHHSVDDTPYGGGAGMLLMPQPIYAAMHSLVEKKLSNPNKRRVIILDPAGQPFNAKMAQEFAQEPELDFICGHYEGYDHRIYDLATDLVSIGDFVLTGGELGAMVMIDAIARFVPGVLGNQDSAETDSFSSGLLEYPQYTRPAEFQGQVVPEVLRSGNHEKIRQWRLYQALKRTYTKRPDLLAQQALSAEAEQMLNDIKNNDC
ncbi:tRNA (guanosine(37)-N1)-methyltransferase TrmD [Agrilactobacillus fermenti]|uniref:tRNA (guanosine(37)-N1)-methyltransferase TrmD n=1 Tax=Agrilactobacillus fermenti TaxID=2586909 RepID=UPI001E46C17F|nr:tRNA (guanosine(37)-N1)-methyltransferase TrmD [Agrilactobacillus fermenti]MCD2256241.1 tRNA (guanosine(37)-N1)-methyltransferase TrmD [Agrilactobacillus fermenti]